MFWVCKEIDLHFISDLKENKQMKITARLERHVNSFHVFENESKILGVWYLHLILKHITII